VHPSTLVSELSFFLVLKPAIHVPASPQKQSKHKNPVCINLTMSSSMSLEEKFEALMKSYQAVSSSNEELKNQNEYLRKQLGNVQK